MILGLFGEKFKFNTNLIIRMMEVIFSPINYIKETFENLTQVLKEKTKIKIDLDEKKKTKKLVQSILIALPIVIIIIILLSSADEVFQGLFQEIFSNIIYAISKIKISTVIAKLILMVVVFVYLICFFNYIITKIKKQEEIQEEEKSISKDNLTIKIILVALNIVYLIFSIVQIQTLKMINESMNYSYYARQGFFQLMVVSIINLVTILIAKKIENTNENKDIKNKRYMNIMSLIMIGFTFIILVSAVIRMYFYENAFGYTLLRLLVYCSLFTEAILLIPTILYIVGKRVNLLKTYFIIILIVYVCMNFANFDNVIAKRNVDRYIETGKIDVEYFKDNIGTGAVEQIIRILEEDRYLDVSINLDKNKVKEERQDLSKERTKNDHNKEIREYLQDIYKELEQENMDFRDLNLSKIYAKKLLKSSDLVFIDIKYDEEVYKENIKQLIDNWSALGEKIMKNKNIKKIEDTYKDIIY
jgi:hypothetical protein